MRFECREENGKRGAEDSVFVQADVRSEAVERFVAGMDCDVEGVPPFERFVLVRAVERRCTVWMRYIVVTRPRLFYSCRRVRFGSETSQGELRDDD